MKTIFLDTRENDSAFIAYLIDSATARGYEVKLTALHFGDIKYENIIVERKAINDFCSSVCSDRMVNQIATMKANPDYNSIVMVSGSYKDLWKDNIHTIPRLNGMKIQIVAWGIPLIECTNDEELVDKMFGYFDHAREIDTPVKRVDKDDKLSMFLALPKVGRADAKKLMREYDNMVELCCASKEELVKILKPSKGALVFNALR